MIILDRIFQEVAFKSCDVVFLTLAVSNILGKICKGLSVASG